jgi:pyruvate dehydrogenase (quinone)/pyruvate oxidase
MATTTAADVLVESLLDWGVDTIFGLPGDGINGVMEALRTRKDKIRFIQVRHEESAAFMACAYAKYTGKLGVCLATSGPGGLHLLNGLYDAKMDSQPVLAITGMHYHDLIGTLAQQDVELDKVFVDVCVFNQRVMGVTHVENLVDLACRTALGYHGVAHITFPADLQDQELSRKHASKRNLAQHTSDVHARSARLPSVEDLRNAAAVLNAGKKVAILAGQGALRAGEQLEAVAEKLGAPIVKALLGKAVIPDDSRYTTGGIGLLGTKPSQAALEECDTLLIAGSSFPYIEFLPKPGKARGVQIEIDARRIGLRYPVEVGLIGDCRTTLEELLPLLARNGNREFLEKAQKGAAEWQALMQKQESRRELPMKPQVVAAELGRRLAATAIVSCDSGTNTTWWARHVMAKRGQMYSCSGNLASMASGLPYTIAAQIAYPERECVAFVGDGGFSMLMAEFATAVKYNLPIKVLVIKNNTLGQIKWEQMVFLGHPEYECDLQPIDFAAFARACGGQGFTITDPTTCGAILDEALAVRGPVLIEAVVDPHEPPMPPSITAEQATHFAEALIKGQPNTKKIALTALADKVREMI